MKSLSFEASLFDAVAFTTVNFILSLDLPLAEVIGYVVYFIILVARGFAESIVLCLPAGLGLISTGFFVGVAEAVGKIC